MKIEYRQTKIDGIVQITTPDERWYYNEAKNLALKSSTWIASYYPKGTAYYKWLATHGWNEAQALKQEAGIRGSKVHQAIEYLELYGSVSMQDKFINPDVSLPEELTIEEWEILMTFYAWHKETNPTLIYSEQTIWNEGHGFAGTLDRIYDINGKRVLLDFKTGQHIWPSHKIQLSSYKHGIEAQVPDLEIDKMGILQLGYRLNKRGWKFTEVEDVFDLFLHAKAICEYENPNAKISQREYPTTLTIKEE